MTDKHMSRRVLDLCDQALELPVDERDGFLSRACGGDSSLRESVESVLSAIDRSPEFLESPSREGPGGVQMTGRRIGDYEVGQRLGEGGMGSVYRATRYAEGYEQQVAIKFVHGYMLGLEFLRRFNAERKILAQLNHPYIAALIDSGTTPEGLPFIVMEFIDGVAIDIYCDDHCLSLEQRIELIRKTAVAIEAAHQNLIVHRDLKPSNVLVTSDGIPKLLDFGVAKLMQPAGDEETGNMTVFGRQAITPDYASPEQILENVVTTVSDVYSLGILSYQLLVGERPYHIPTANHKAMVHTVETLAVLRPSTCLKGVSDKKAREDIARARATTVDALYRHLHGDIDNILLKALDQDPGRRYSSVTGFADDLERFLLHLPVTAHADSVGYRLGKFLRRRWLPVSAVALILASLTVGIVAYAIQAREAQRQREIAIQQAENARRTVSFLKDLLYVGDPFKSGGGEQTVADVLEYAEQNLSTRYTDHPATRASILTALSEIYASRGEYVHSEELSRQALAMYEGQLGVQSNDAANAYRANALSHYYLNDYQRADGLFSRAVNIFNQIPDPDWAGLANAYEQWGMVQEYVAGPDQTIALYQKALSVYRGHALDDLPQYLTLLNNLGTAYVQKGDYEIADQVLSEAIDIAANGSGGQAHLAVLMANRAGALKNLDRYPEAGELYEKAAVLLEMSLGLEHPETITTLTSLANLYRQTNQLQRARETILKAEAAAEQGLPADHFLTSYVQNIGGAILCEGGNVPRGTRMAEASLATRRKLLPEGHWAVSSGEGILGACLAAAEKYAEAEPILLNAFNHLEETLGGSHEVTLATRQRIHKLYRDWGKSREAVRWE